MDKNEIDKITRLVTPILYKANTAARLEYWDDEVDDSVNGITFYFGKYGYSVDENCQDEDLYELRKLRKEIESALQNQFNIKIEWSDKYNEVIITKTEEK